MRHRVEQARRVERVAKRVYDSIKKERLAFLDSIDGIHDQRDREWYSSVVLNRLMFLYFLQRRCFLDNDPHYLTHRFQQMRQGRADKSHTVYRLFLRRLFHEGLAQAKDRRAPQLHGLLGNVPYLNVGIFDEHELEVNNPDLHIPDRALERILRYFDQYHWHLDNRPLANDREINPDVLGYVFEKYVNQKQMGAYYTKEDITEYIARNTIVPFLLDATVRACPNYFQADGPAWSLLRHNYESYLFEAMRHGVDVPLPTPIAAGLENVAARMDWNKPAPAGFALPTETWREHLARRRHCLDLRQKLHAGEVRAVNDLITYNLDIRRFAEDVLRTCESPSFLWAFWQALTKVTVLDPTCGSGAFLCAALLVLEKLYNVCLDRMQDFLNAGNYPDFCQVIEQMRAHSNRAYFVYKSIIVHNLHGVDIMPEAVEICKLRLFLKLVGQVQNVEQLEPLPDVGFNIRAGNTLVGAVSGADLEEFLKDIRAEKPFHWFAEFPGVMTGGGFDVIIGNPPYVEISDVKGQYNVHHLQLAKTGNLFAVCLERFFALGHATSRFGVIVPISAVCTPRMLPLMKLVEESSSYLCLSNFAVRPAKLFVGVDMNLTIFLGSKQDGKSNNRTKVYSTAYLRWKTAYRSLLFDTLVFQPTKIHAGLSSIVKIGSELESKLLDKLRTFDNLERFAIQTKNSETIYYHSGGRYFRKCLRQRLSNEYKELQVKRGFGSLAICLLSSSLYYWFWIVISDCYHVTKRDINNFPVPNSLAEEKTLDSLAEQLLTDLWGNSAKRIRNRADGSQQIEVNFRMARSKPLLDQIDQVLARYYDLTEEELDFLVSFDAKFRLS